MADQVDINGNPLYYTIYSKMNIEYVYKLYTAAFTFLKGYTTIAEPRVAPARDGGYWPGTIPIKFVPLIPNDPSEECKGIGFVDPTAEIPVTQEDIDKYGDLVVPKAVWRTFTWFAGFKLRTITVKNPETQEVIRTYQKEFPLYIRVSDIYSGKIDPDTGEFERRFWMGVGKMAFTCDYGITWDASEEDHYGIPSGNFGWTHKDIYTPSWEHAFPVGDGRIVIPNVYSKQYPLDESKWKGTKLIAGVIAEHNNYIFQNEPYMGPMGRGAKAQGQCYIGNDEVLYYDCIHINGMSIGTSRGLPDPEPDGQIPNSGPDYCPGWQGCGPTPVKGIYSNPVNGNGWAWTGPSLLFTGAGAILYQDANTYVLGSLPMHTTQCCHNYGEKYLWKLYSPELGEIIYDVAPYIWAQGQEYFYIQRAAMLDYNSLKANLMSAIRNACSSYASHGGVNYEYAGTPPSGGVTGHPNADFWGPSYSCTVNVVVKGRIQGNKIVPIEAYPQGYQWSGDLGGWHWTIIAGHGHHSIGWLGAHISKDEHNLGRRGIAIFPLMALSSSVIIGKTKDCYGYGIDMVDPTRPPGYDLGVASVGMNGRYVYLYGWPNWTYYPGRHCTESAEEFNEAAINGAYDAPKPEPMDYQEVPTDENGAAQYFQYQKTKWNEFLVLSTDGGKTWGDYLPDPIRIGQTRGPDDDWGGVPWVPEEHEGEVQPPYNPIRTYHLTALPKTIIVKDGVGVMVIEGRLFQLSASGFTEITLVEDATELDPATNQMKPCTVSDVVSTVAKDQFLFTTSKGLTLCYNNYTKMKTVHVSGDYGDGLAPYFIPTFHGRSSPMFSGDKEYPYDTTRMETELRFTKDTLENPIYNQRYIENIEIAGGTRPYTLTKIGGELPAGLTLNTDYFVIEGTPTKIDGCTIDLQVKDDSNPPVTVVKKYTLKPSDPYKDVLTIKDGESGKITIPAAGIDRYYYYPFEAFGGQYPYTWSWSGDTPTGVTFNTTYGYISGYPNVQKTNIFWVEITDSHTPPNTFKVAVTMDTKESLESQLIPNYVPPT